MTEDTQTDQGADHETEPDPAPVGATFTDVLSDQTTRGARYRQRWRGSPERRRIVRAAVAIAATGLLITALAALIAYNSAPKYSADKGSKTLIVAAPVGVAALYVGGLAFLLYRNRQRRSWYDREVVLQAHQALTRAETEAGPTSQLDLATLWSLTQKRLDYYHKLATGQSEKSFTYGLLAAGIGFLIIAASAVVAGLARSPTASVTAGLLGVGGGGLAAYIGATFMRLQENATSQLRAYFAQPLEFSRFLAAERLLDKLDAGDRPAATQVIIAALAREPTPAEADDPK
jgi:hypothetical protein